MTVNPRAKESWKGRVGGRGGFDWIKPSVCHIEVNKFVGSLKKAAGAYWCFPIYPLEFQAGNKIVSIHSLSAISYHPAPMVT